MSAPGFIPCSVEYHHGAWLVAFGDGRSLLLQSDYDQAAFAVGCGALCAPNGWDGSPSALGDAWADFDATSISEFPDCYLDVADESGVAL